MNDLKTAVANIIKKEGASNWFGGYDTTENGITVRCIERTGGYEGAGEEFYLVWEVTDENSEITYWRIDGYYASYDGAYADIDDLKQVQKVERMVTFYE